MAPRLLLCLASLAVISSLVYGRRVIRAAPGSATTGCYVVKLKDSVNHEQFMAAVRQVTPLAMESKLYTKVEGVVNLFTMKLSHAAADKVSCLPNYTRAVNNHLGIDLIFIVNVLYNRSRSWLMWSMWKRRQLQGEAKLAQFPGNSTGLIRPHLL